MKKKISRSEKESLDNFIKASAHVIARTLGHGFEQKPVKTLVREGKQKARSIIRKLKPFSKSETFPESFNPRAIHALFASAFLYISTYYCDFIRVVRLRTYPLSTDKSPCEFLMWMIENFHYYEYMSQFEKSTARLYSDLNESFKKQHVQEGLRHLVEDQIIMVIDYTNPIDCILHDIKIILEKEQNETVTRMTNLLIQDGCDQQGAKETALHLLRYGAALVDDNGQKSRGPETYLPQWYEALMVYRMKLQGKREGDIVRRVYGQNQNHCGYASRKTIVHTRTRLAERLTGAAFHRVPLTAWHKSA